MEIIKNRLRHFGRMEADTDLLEENQTVIIPDIRPDALEVVGVHTWLNVQEKGCSEGTLRVSGQVNCTICYLSADRQLPCTVTAAVPFSFVKEIEDMGGEDRLLASVRLLSGTAMMVNPRKLQVKVQLQVTQRLFRSQVAEYVEKITGGEENGVQCLERANKICVVADIIEKRLVLNDEIRLSSQLPDEESVMLRSAADWVTEDVKLLPGKIMVRGHIDVQLSSMDTHGAYLGTSCYAVPFSQIIESSSVEPEDKVEISYAPVREEIELMTGNDGVTTMAFAFAATVECIVKKEQEIRAVRDIYSTRWEMREEWTELAFLDEGQEHQMPLAIRESILLEGCAAEILNVSVVAEDAVALKGEQTIGAGFHLCVIYKETDGTVAAAVRKIYGEVRCPVPMGEKGLCRVLVKEPVAMITGEDEVQVSFEGTFCCRESCGAGRRVVHNCAIEPTKSKNNAGRPSLILRPIHAEETVWSLAKAYNTVPAVLASANKLGRDEVIPAGKMVLIPFVDR